MVGCRKESGLNFLFKKFCFVSRCYLIAFLYPIATQTRKLILNYLVSVIIHFSRFALDLFPKCSQRLEKLGCLEENGL